MGLFSFIKSAGKKLGLVDDEGETPPDAEAVKKELEGLNLGTDKVEVTVEGDKVVLKGDVENQSIFEKAVIAVGNTLGISKVEAAELKVAAAPAKEPVLYTVKKGDTLWKIAEEHYGKGQGAKYTEIVKANTPPVKNPDLIQPGWVLRIPPKA